VLQLEHLVHFLSNSLRQNDILPCKASKTSKLSSSQNRTLRNNHTKTYKQTAIFGLADNFPLAKIILSKPENITDVSA
jgi:hypothetical protein